MPTGTRRCSYFAITRRNSCSGSMLQPCVSAFIRAADRLVADFRGQKARCGVLISGRRRPRMPGTYPTRWANQTAFHQGHCVNLKATGPYCSCGSIPVMEWHT